MMDRIVQACLKLVLEPIFEADFQPSSYGFRPRRRAVGRDRGDPLLRLTWLRAGVLSEDGVNRNTFTGTPQGGILSPLLANIALSVVDEHFQRRWDALGPQWSRTKHQRAGGARMKLVRYADDFVVLVRGTRADADALWDEVAAVLVPMGLRLSVEKTTVTHIDTGFDFLGWRIQRRRIRGHGGKTAIYTYPSRKSLASIRDKVGDADPPGIPSNAR